MNNKLNSIEISSFRGIKNLSIENLGSMNIITGSNNSGKTSFLEALMMLTEPGAFYNIIRVARLREVGKLMLPIARSRLVSYQLFSYLFNQKEENMKLEITGKYNSSVIQLAIEGRVQYELVNEYMINDLTNSQYQLNELLSLDEEIETFTGKYYFSTKKTNPETEFVVQEKELNFNKYTIDSLLKNNRNSNRIIRYNFISSIDHIIRDSLNHIIKNENLKEEVIEILKIFDEEIEDLVIIKDENRYIHCIKSKFNGLMPISVYGDGIKKVITLAAGIASSQDGILLIDEIETSIHKKVMPRIFHWLIESCNKFNVQLFLTTHSLEVMDEILNSNQKAIKNDLLRVVTLKKNNGNTFARVLTGSKAIELRQNFDMELR